LGVTTVAGRASQVGRVLTACVRGDHEQAISAANVLGSHASRLADAAGFHGVEGFVHRQLGDAGVLPGPVADALREDFFRVMMTRHQVLTDLRAVASALDGADVEFLVVKGPSLAEVLYGDPLLRAYQDLDLVVRAEEFPDAIAALEASDHHMLDANWDLLLELRPGEVHLTGPAGTVIDLHWHLLNSADLRDRFPIDMNGLFARSIPASIGEVEVRTLEPVDRLLFVALHACVSGGDRLIWLNDVAVCAGEPLDGNAVSERADAWRVRTALSLMLCRAERIVGSDPAHPQATDVRSPLVWLDALANRLAPVENSLGDRSTARLLARAAGDDAISSGVELARLVGAWLRRGAPRDQFDRIDRNPASNSSPLHPSGGAAARADFLAAVASNRM
jgi:hypothetical protein